MSVPRIVPVIMSGGSGTRLWPLSTDTRPKQFHALGGGRSMIEETALRLSGSDAAFDFLPPVVIANAAHGEHVRSLLQASGITPAPIVLEPQGRNTAAAAAIAAMIVSEWAPGAHVLLAPADHLVTDPAAFRDAIRKALSVVTDQIVTFGITPTGPETGYGYILQGEAIAPGVHRIRTFKEKPDLPTATRYLAEGGYSWNSGIFFFSPRVLLDELSTFAPDIRKGAREALSRARDSGDEILLDPAAFAAIRSEAVDRAVMEKTGRAAVVPCDIGWADVGSWAELWRLSDKDAAGNVADGQATLLDCANTLVRADGMQVSVIGVEDLIVVASGNSVLVMPRSRAQDVKKVIPGKE